jgi:hypothetical protein
MTKPMFRMTFGSTHITSALRNTTVVMLLFTSAAPRAMSQSVPLPEHKVVAGIATSRLVPGAPYELAGKRIVFANWYYIQPGDLDWRDDQGKSVYVKGNAGPFGAHHVGINAPHGIRIMAEKPQILGPLERPHRMILHDGGVYKGWTDSDYYESSDAIHWQKKAALKLGPELDDGFYQVFLDPVAPPAERYKALWVGHLNRVQFDAFRARHPEGWEPRAVVVMEEKDRVTCLCGGVSPDGIHWKTLPEPLVVEYCDTWNTGYFDTVLSEYVLYTRHWSIGPRTDRLPPDIRNSWTGVGRRSIGRAASRDFQHFTPSEMILEPTPDMLPSEQLYTNCHTTIPGAPDQHLMFPAIWNGSVDDTTRIALASSHDGKTWHWVPGGDLLHTQPFGRWDGGCIWATPELLELPGGDWALPYLAHTLPHKYPRGQQVGGMGYAVWPKGRLVAVAADDQGGFTMIPFLPPGKTTLKINAVTLRTGWVKVEVAGVDGRSLADCIAIVGDQHWTRVIWKGANDLGTGPKSAVTLRVEMKQAKIFGFEID